MTKTETIKEAKAKANLSKKDQVVFKCGFGVLRKYNYTHLGYSWNRRKQRIPIVTKITTVIPDTIS